MSKKVRELKRYGDKSTETTLHFEKIQKAREDYDAFENKNNKNLPKFFENYPSKHSPLNQEFIFRKYSFTVAHLLRRTFITKEKVKH